jgi:hypothetical protein
MARVAGDAALAEVAVESPAVRIRGVHVVPVRHHSPAIARATAAVIRAVRPRLVLIEGPDDANHLIDALTAPDAVAPFALLAYRPPEIKQATADAAPQVVFYPFCDYSPELVALRTARELGIEARFCDIPARASLEAREPDEQTPPDADDAPHDPTADAPELSLYDIVAQRLGFQSHEEWWECLYESCLRDPARLLQLTQEWGELVVQAGGISDYDALRNAYMWRHVEQSGVPPERIVLVVGAAHAAAFAQPDFRAEYDPNHPLLQARPAEFVITPYSFPRLSEQLGYGAGNRAPQFYQDAWELGGLENATLATLTRLVNAMKLQGDVASHADAIEAFRLAKQLAALRGKPEPGYDETIDAAIAAFGRGNAERVQTPLKRLLIGERVGSVSPAAIQPPIQAEFYRLTHELRIPVKDDPTDLRLNLAEPHAVQQSIFLHRLLVAKIPFADLISGEAATYRQLARLQEKWRLQWTPLTDVALVEATIYGNTLREVATRRIAPRLAAARFAGASERSCAGSRAVRAARPVRRRAACAGRGVRARRRFRQPRPRRLPTRRANRVRRSARRATGDVRTAAAARLHPRVPAPTARRRLRRRRGATGRRGHATPARTRAQTALLGERTVAGEPARDRAERAGACVCGGAGLGAAGVRAHGGRGTVAAGAAVPLACDAPRTGGGVSGGTADVARAAQRPVPDPSCRRCTSL